jgi:hypothetical protein
MSAQQGQSRLIAGALGIAVAGAALIGFLISRPRTPLTPVTPAPVSTVPAAVGPSATAGYSVADDLATQQVVVFGGIADDQATWLWNGTRWNLADPQTSPPGRIDAAAAYDPALHLVLLFGGHGPPGTDLNDTWAWGGATWRELDNGTNAPPPSDGVMAWDPALSQMVLVAGGSASAMSGTWTWRARWIPLASDLPFPASSVSVGFDPTTGELLAAALPQGVEPEAGGSLQTWAWDGSAWRDITLSDVPLANSVLGLGWDPPSQHLLLFGAGASSPRSSNTWVWSGAAWRESSTAGATILGGVIVSTDTSLLLVGTLDTGEGAPRSLKVWLWAAGGWKAE